MKSMTFILFASLFTFGSVSVLAEGLVLPSNATQDSSYPNSSQLDPAPNIPDPVHGTPGESYREPDRNIPSLKSTTIYNPDAPTTPGDNRPTVPGNSDITDSPNSDNSGIIVPEGGGGAGVRR